MEKRKVKLKTRKMFLLRILLIVLICCQNLLVFSQDQRINIFFKNKGLNEILLEVKKQSSKNMVFNNNLIEQYKNETIEIKNVTLEEALKKILDGKKLKFHIIDNVIVIEPVDNEKSTNQNIDTKIGKTQIIRGQIIDKSTEMPIPGATILVNDSTLPQVKGTTSDADGYFKIENNPS